jgi:YqaJ-like viral recombinase domain
MRVITADQGTPEWMMARVGVPSGSKFADIMAKGGGVTRATYLTALALERITGTREEFKTTFAMDQGTEREPFARAAYEAHTGRLVEEIGFCMHDTLMVGVSPDGLVGLDGMTEYKCPMPKTHLEYLRLDQGKCPSAYKWQIQGQMWITDRAWCDFVSYNPDFPANAQMAIRRVKRDDQMIKELETEVIKFLSDIGREVDFIRDYRLDIEPKT